VGSDCRHQGRRKATIGRRRLCPWSHWSTAEPNCRHRCQNRTQRRRLGSRGRPTAAARVPGCIAYLVPPRKPAAGVCPSTLPADFPSQHRQLVCSDRHIDNQVITRCDWSKGTSPAATARNSSRYLADFQSEMNEEPASTPSTTRRIARWGLLNLSPRTRQPRGIPRDGCARRLPWR
jgi:hypothetical protein